MYAVTNYVQGIGLTAASTTSGGWATAGEIHSNGLITSDFDSRKPVGQIAERAPSIEEGGISLLPDGRMRVVFPLRKGVTWQDGTPLTAQDLVFSLRFLSDRALGYPTLEAITLMDAAEAPDDNTFVLYYKQPYYLGASLGVRLFWPVPRHLMEAPFEQYLQNKNPEQIINLPYWSSEYVGAGPFRVTSWDPSSEIVLQAYDGYFLGRPKADIIRVRLLADQQTLFSNLLAGAVDVFPETVLNAELVTQLKETWEASNRGTVHYYAGSTRFLAPQMRPDVQIESAILDQRVRAALYHALDRETLAEVLQVGHREMAAYAILPAHDPLYLATKDALRPYAYDPERAKAMLRDLGWTPGTDGALRNNADGRPFRTAITASTSTTRDVPALADYWRRIGIEVDERITPPALARDQEHAAQYPGYENTSKAPGDGIIRGLEGPAATAQTRWAGNRAGYEDPRAQALLLRYRSSLSPREQFDAMKAISDFIAAELPFLPTYGQVDGVGVRAGIRALDDHMGGGVPGSGYGTFARNAHLWDVL
ncbi:MAG: hypothetical protein HW416_2720 [Chloroflexi bacterium]|nr:hypothetical protein [Chloroflexota bacterium]